MTQVLGRTNGSAPPEATTHPLLLDTSSGNSRTSGSQLRVRQNQRGLAGISASGGSELLQTIQELVSNGAVQLFSHIMTRGRDGEAPQTFQLSIPAGAVASVGRPSVVRGNRVERSQRQPETVPSRRDLEPLLTIQRWTEEAKILNGEFVTERTNKLATHIILALLPAAIEEARRKEEEEAKRKEEEEHKRKEEEETKRKEEEARQREEEEAKQREEEEAKQKEEEETTQREEEGGKQHGEHPPAKAESEAPTIHVDSQAGLPADGQDAAMDIMPSASEANVSTEDQPMHEAELPPNDIDTEMTDATTPVPSAVEGSSLPEGSSSTVPPEQPQRVTVMIHGNEVDITDTGIDPTFLEALPDDMREEVLSQHIRDQRAARVERPADSQISAEFLDALPPEIRAEIIQQEALERARQRAEPPATGAGGPSDIDAASFIASLDPGLRATVLMDQDEGFIQTLPSAILDEAGVFHPYRARVRGGARGSGTTRSQPGPSSRKTTVHHDAIQLLDKSGIAVLVRLLFFPQVLRKNLLFKVLVNICENSKTRTELFNLLLGILQDGTGDLAAVDKSFSQLSVKNSKPSRSPAKQKAADYFNVRATANLQNEAVPDLITQRCLEALTFIVSANTLSSMFFLTEHELPASMKRTASKKSKGKERQLPQTHYPIVLLLNLLDRDSLLRTPSIVDSIVGLLATVTRPLATIKDMKEEGQTDGPPADNSEASASAPAAPAPSSAATVAAEVSTSNTEQTESPEQHSSSTGKRNPHL
jgi:E3 ubiquitin-protein ligase HUWE1